MKSNPGANSRKRRSQSLLPSIGGLRMTKQRQEVYNVLLQDRDHPTANVLYARVRSRMPSVSLATVYNCLEALVEHKLVRQVNFEREPSRFCSNLEDHGHFSDIDTGAIYDVTFKRGVVISDIMNLPVGSNVKELEFTLRGVIEKPETAQSENVTPQ